MRFLIAVLTTHERNGWIQPQLNEVLNNLGFTSGHMVSVGNLHNHQPAAAARNFLGRHVKSLSRDERPDWVVMIDNDMKPDHNLLDVVKDAPKDADVVVPQIHMWDETKAKIILCWGMEGDSDRFTMEPEQKFYPLTKAGTGVIFIKPHVFDKLDLPYFWYPYNELGGIEGTEDVTFSGKVLAHGMKIYGNASITVGHLHNVNLAVVARAIEKARQEGFAQASLASAEACPA